MTQPSPGNGSIAVGGQWTGHGQLGQAVLYPRTTMANSGRVPMAEIRELHRKSFRFRGDNVMLYVDHRFLLLPVSEVEVDADAEYLEVNEESLAMAFDATPDLPDRVVDLAWRQGILFHSDVTSHWAASVARGLSGMSAIEVKEAFEI